MKVRLNLVAAFAVAWGTTGATSVQAAIVGSASQGNGSFTHAAGQAGWLPQNTSALSTVETGSLPTNTTFFHQSGFGEDTQEPFGDGSGAAGAISHTFGADGFGNTGPAKHWVFYNDGAGMGVSFPNDTWDGSATFSMNFKVDFTLDEYGLGVLDPVEEAQDGHDHENDPHSYDSASVPIFLELPFGGYVPFGYGVDFNASLKWIDNTTDGSQIPSVTLADSFSWDNTTNSIDIGNFGGILADDNVWGGLTSNAGDTFTVEASFLITITGSGSIQDDYARGGLSFFDQVAYDNGLVTNVVDIPEPSTLVFGTMLLAGITGIRRRRS